MTKKIKDLAIKVGSYESEGKTKNRYQNVGAVLETAEGGKFILLDRTFNPAGAPNPDNKSTVLISMFDIKDDKKEARQEAMQPQAAQPNTMDDEIPF